MQLTKGANLILPDVATVTVACTWSARPGLEADLSALLLVGGRVRGDEDFVFYNQPASADMRVRHDGKRTGPGGSTTDRVVVDLRGLDVDTVAFAVSLDAPGRRSFADLGTVRATVTGPGGAALADFAMDTAGPETAIVALELYTRDRSWKVRAVGQGYHDGLAGLARDFGVDVAEAQPPPPPALDWRRPPVPAGYEL